MQSRELLQRRKEVYAVISKLFAEVEDELKPLVENTLHHWPDGTLSTAAKISKGEYLEGLPYMVLDFPRALKGSPKMLFRTLFWWGNGFSCIGYMEGDLARKAWGNWLKQGLPENFRVSTSPDWQHDLQAFPMSGCEKPNAALMAPRHFWVGATKPLDSLEALPQLAKSTYGEWIRLLS
jgi:hypothetical protein